MAQAIRAILLASATAATLVCRRSINRASHGRLPLPCFLRIANDGHGTGDQQPSQVAIALLGDAAELVLAAGRMLLGHQPNPGGKVAPRAELLPVADLGNQGGGHDRADARDLLQATARFARAMPGDGCVCRLIRSRHRSRLYWRASTSRQDRGPLGRPGYL